MIRLLVLTACMKNETQPNPNLEHEGVITQQAAVGSTFPNIKEFRMNKIGT